MIPRLFIEQWQKKAPWATIEMVEQDLIISKALISLYNDPLISDGLVFRGGTALNKLYLNPPARYSEDIDLVQIQSGPIGEIADSIRNALNWLGRPAIEPSKRSFTLKYKYTSVNNLPMKLKIEINTTEHFQVLELEKKLHNIDSEWFKGDCLIPVYQLEELMATKLRALYQRRKGRDLFDLWLIFHKGLMDVDKVIKIFKKYCDHQEVQISNKNFMDNLEKKVLHKDFKVDMNALLPHHIEYDFDEAFRYVKSEIISRV